MQVAVFEWGEPKIKNVININYKTHQMQLQTPGHFGSYWTSFDKALKQCQIDYYFICLADSEIKRLQIKLTIIENGSILKPKPLRQQGRFKTKNLDKENVFF